jgi:hypothetical protein
MKLNKGLLSRIIIIKYIEKLQVIQKYLQFNKHKNSLPTGFFERLS